MEYYDQVEHRNLQNLTQIVTSSHFLKKATKLLLSLSVFSFLLSHYSSFVSSYNYHYFSSILPLNFDKNYVFLIFNGILMFIARMSCSLHSRPGFELNYDDHQLAKNVQDSLQSATESTAGESIRVEREGIIEDHDDQDMLYNLHAMQEEGEMRSSATNDHEYLKVEDEEQVDGKCEAEEDEENGGTLAAENGEEEVIIQSHDNGIYLNGHDGEDTAKIGAMSTEELNKKFDEFIRRMKEEIRIDAQRQLIMV